VKSRRLLWGYRAFAGIVAFGFLGYISNPISARASENAVARRVLNQVGQDIFVLSPDSSSSFPSYPRMYPESETILRRTGVVPRVCDARVCFPWVGIARARSVGPYVLEVEWGYERGGLSGLGGHARVVAIFGVIVYQHDRFDWAT
jgi:hypothetical protein